jgi:hypothetical protein
MKSTLKTLRVLLTGNLLLFFCTTHSQTGSKNSITGISIKRLFPVTDTNSAFIKHDTSYANIYYYKDMVLYNDLLNWYLFSEKDPAKIGVMPNYFVVSRGKHYGYYYDTCKQYQDSCKGRYEKKLPADSFLNKQWYFRGGFNSSTITLLDEEFNPGSEVLTKTYFFKRKDDTTVTGKVILSFNNKIQQTDFTLCDILDTVPNTKLCKMKTIVDMRHMKGYKGVADTITLSIELSEAIIKNKEELLQYFERAKQNELKEEKGRL